MNIKVIDLSWYEAPKDIDYLKLSTQVDGVILRAAYSTRKDVYFEEHYKRFSDLGMPLGVFHFITDYHSAEQQANIMFEAVQGKNFQLDYWCDVELEKNARPLTRATVERYMQLVDKEIAEFDIYSSRYYWDSIMGCSIYKDRKLWIAHYGATSPLMPVTGGWVKWWLWQHTDRAVYEGYPGGIDSSLFCGTKQNYEDWTGSTLPPNPPDDEPIFYVECIAQVALNIRSTPDSSSPSNIVGTLLNGDVVGVIEEYLSWLKIDKGWISSYYTQRVEDPNPPEDLTYEQKTDICYAWYKESHP